MALSIVKIGVLFFKIYLFLNVYLFYFVCMSIFACMSICALCISIVSAEAEERGGEHQSSLDLTLQTV